MTGRHCWHQPQVHPKDNVGCRQTNIKPHQLKPSEDADEAYTMESQRGKDKSRNLLKLHCGRSTGALMLAALVIASSCVAFSQSIPNRPGRTGVIRAVPKTRRDTNPPFPTFSEESGPLLAEGSDGTLLVTTTLGPISEETASIAGESESQEPISKEDKTTTIIPIVPKRFQNLHPRLNNIIRRTFPNASSTNQAHISNSTNTQRGTKNKDNLDLEVQPTQQVSVVSQEDAEEVQSAEESGAIVKPYTSLLTPLPTRQSPLLSSTTPFSHVIANKTARINANNNNHNANLSLYRFSNSHNAIGSVNAVRRSNTNSPSSSLSVQGVRPTSSVIQYNPRSYNKIVKTRKITTINGKSRNGESDLQQTTLLPSTLDDEDVVQSTDNDAEGTTTLKTGVVVGHQNNSRAISGFSKKGPVRINVSKTRPKPIIIRDHEAYLRNLTTETTTLGFEDEVITEPTHHNDNTVVDHSISSKNGDGRRVKVTMGNRPGPGVVATITSDFPILAVNDSAPSSFGHSNNFTYPVESRESQESKVPVLDIKSIKPSPSSTSPPSPDEYTTRHFFKEEFGIHKETFDEPEHEEDEEEEEDFPINFDKSEQDNQSKESGAKTDMEVDATTERYSVHIPSYLPSSPPPNQLEKNALQQLTNINSRNRNGAVRDPTPPTPPATSTTLKYRDYFAEVGEDNEENGDHDQSSHNVRGNMDVRSAENNLSQRRNNDDGSPKSPSSSTPAVTVTVTKTALHNEITPTESSLNATKLEFQIPAPVGSHSHNDNSASPSFASLSPSTATPSLPTTPSVVGRIGSHHNASNNNDVAHSNQVSSHHVTNSVEEHNNPTGPGKNNQEEHVHNTQPVAGSHEVNSTSSSSTPSSKVTSKEATTVFFEKHEEPHFTSSSYEFSTTKEYSYNSHDGEHEHDHSHHQGQDHDPQHENSASESKFTDLTSSNANRSGSHNDINDNPSPTPFHINVTTTKLTTSSSTTAADATTSASTRSTTTNASPSSLVPVIVIVPKNASHHPSSTEVNRLTYPISPGEHNVGPTEPILPDISNNDISGESQEKNYSFEDTKGGGSGERLTGVPSFPNVKNLPSVKVPASYQFPVLVKLEVRLPQKMFCSHLSNFRQMIAAFYAGKKRGVSVSPDQIEVYTEPNCTSSSDIIIPPDNFIVNNESSTLAPALRTSVLTTTTSTIVTSSSSVSQTLPGKVTVPSAKNDTSTAKPLNDTVRQTTTSGPRETPKSENKSVSLPRRRRRSPQKVESLIYNNKNSSAEDAKSADFDLKDAKSFNLVHKNTSPLPTNSIVDEIVEVYFFVKNKHGKYDQELTMAFYEYWNQTQGSQNPNGSGFQGVFYQKVKKVDMVSAKLVGTEEDGNENSGIIAAIAIASIAATTLFLIGVLLLVLRHRQAQTKFAKRCTPVTLDDYSLDNISVTNSFRRKQRLRGSKRSYTNAAFDDHTAPSRVVTASTLQTALSDVSGLDAEFKGIPNVNPTLDDIPQGAETKNRYANVIPMPDTRVLLTFQEDQPNSDYINANFVRGLNGEAKRYIITQGPLDETVVDFWRMVWEQQVRVIFMLTDFAEAGHGKCADYYPRSETIDCSQLHGDFQVTLEKRDITENCTTSFLVIKDMERNLRRDVVHFWYHSWPDKGVPTTAKPTVEFLTKSRKFTKEATPVVVHCSPGTGRSGTLVACDIAIKEMELNQKVDIPRLVLRIRQDRAGCVQTREQYLHIYDALHHYMSRYPLVNKDEVIGSVPTT